MRLDANTVNIVSRTEPLEHRKWAERDPDTIPTPFAAWNEACHMEGGRRGIAMGWYVVLAGDTKQGKTLLALQCMGNALVNGGRNIGFVNLEMSIPQLRVRVYSQMTGVPAYKIEPGDSYDPREAEFVADWFAQAQEQGRRKFLVNTEPFLALDDMMDLMTLWHTEHECEVFCVDYMQLCEATGEDGIAGETRAISKALRLFCREHNVVVFAVSQFNNQGGNDHTQKPHAGSLYGGRRIAQDSSQTVLLDHSRRAETGDGKLRTWLLMPYNRSGPPVEIPIEWEWKTMTAKQAEPDIEHQWPGYPEEDE